MSVSTEKSYIYKHFSNLGSYIDNLPKPVNEFSFTNEINTAGASLEIELPISFEDAMPSIQYDILVDENGDEIVDDENDNIVSDVSYVVSGIPSLGDRIEVYEFSNDYPNGKKMFSGLVSRWEADYKRSTVVITVLSYGVQLDNYLMQVLPNTEITENDTSDSQITLRGLNYSDTTSYHGVAQVFQIGSSSTISSITVHLQADTDLDGVVTSVTVYSGTPSSPGTYLGGSVQWITTEDTVAGITPCTFEFTSPISLTASTDYFFLVYNLEFERFIDDYLLYIAIDSTSSYGSGGAYTYNDNTIAYTPLAGDLRFSITTPTGSIGNQFNSYDPSDMLRETLNSFNNQGGIPTYTTSSIANTDTTVSYTFKYTTILDAVKKIVELAPANWYWYIDQATNILYFQSRSSEPDHILVRGNHIENFDLKYSLEGVKNTVVLSGGDDGSGENLVADDSNTTSVASYGPWLELATDNRVTNSDTADIMVESILNEKSQPKFSGTITVPASKYDITSFSIGDIIGFANFNTLINSLNLQIFSISYTPNQVELVLAVLPPTQSKRIEDIKRNLYLEETRDNPNNV